MVGQNVTMLQFWQIDPLMQVRATKISSPSMVAVFVRRLDRSRNFESPNKLRSTLTMSHPPHRSWCKWRVASRRPSSHHRSQPASRRKAPLLVADYCYTRDYQDEEWATTLVAKVYPAKALIAIMCEQKGFDDYTVSRLAQIISDSGYLQIAYKHDQVCSSRSLINISMLKAGRKGLVQATPESSAVGESQSNGKAESSIHRIEDLIRTYKSAIESHISSQSQPSTQ